MSRAKNIAKNTFWGLAGRIIDTLSYILVIGIVARYLGVSDFGLYSFMMSILGIALPVLLMSGRIISRDIAKDRGRAEILIGNTMSIVAIGSGIMLVFLIASCLFFPAKLDLTLAIILMGTIFTMGVARSISVVFLALESLHFDAILSIFEALSLLLLTFLAVYFDMGFSFIFVAIIISQALRYSMMRFFLSKYFSIKLRFQYEKGISVYLVKETAPLVASIFLTQLYINAGVFILMIMSTTYDVGLYQAPFRIISRLQIIPLTISASLLPLLSQLAANKESWEELRSKVYHLLKFLLVISIPVSIIGFILADDIVRLLFGPNFSGSAVSLRIQLIGVGFFFIVAFFDTLFVSINRQRSFILVNAAGLVLGLMLNLALVPKFGYIGSSMAVPVLNLICVLIAIYLLRDIISYDFTVGAIIKPCFSATVVIILLYGLSWLNRYILAGLAIAIYPVVLYFSKTFSIKEIGVIKRTANLRPR